MDRIREKFFAQRNALKSTGNRCSSPNDPDWSFSGDRETLLSEMQADTTVISKKVFCIALQMIREQETIDEVFSRSLETVGNGHFVFGAANKYRQALLFVLKEAAHDRYDYIDWWLYEGAPDYTIWSADETEKWVLKEPEALYDFITSEN